jgi:hypothetical protein
MTFEQWKAAGEQLAQFGGALQWWIGDWWNAREPYGDRVDAVQAMMVNVATARTYASVAKNVSIRIDTLSFAHHRLVESLSPDEQKHWLERAAAGDWTVREMRAAVQDGKPKRIPYAISDEEFEKDEPTDHRRALRIHVLTGVEMAELAKAVVDGHKEALTNNIRADIHRAAQLWTELSKLADQPRVNGSAEQSVEERRALNAKLAEADLGRIKFPVFDPAGYAPKTDFLAALATAGYAADVDLVPEEPEDDPADKLNDEISF